MQTPRAPQAPQPPPLPPWSIVAKNLPGHAGNAIHTDEGARAAGFERALVAGVTSYAYCCHPLLERLGLDWLAGGEAEVRFRAPVFAADLLWCPVIDRSDGGLTVLLVAERAERPLVEVSAWSTHRESEPLAVSHDRGAGEWLEALSVRLEGEYGPEYGLRAGDDQALCPDAGVVHPAVWPAVANSVFHSQLARGSWVHARSRIRHFALASAGEEAEVATVVKRRFPRGGERVVADVIVRVRSEVVAVVEHEAIVDLSLSDG